MTETEFSADLRKRLAETGITDLEDPRIEAVSLYDGPRHRRVLKVDGRVFASWDALMASHIAANVIWHFDEIGHPDLCFKGINRFRGRWEGGGQ